MKQLAGSVFCTSKRSPSISNRHMHKAKAYSAASPTWPLNSRTIKHGDRTDDDVQIEILFCGICHSDLHQVRNEWSGVNTTVYTCLPCHEIVGRVTKIGSAVTKFKPGDQKVNEGLREAAQIRCEVPLFHRHGVS